MKPHDNSKDEQDDTLDRVCHFYFVAIVFLQALMYCLWSEGMFLYTALYVARKVK
jgi:hypothetical protein